jgi:predicted nucleic acid-binding protein
LSILTFLDSSVLIAAHRGQSQERESALNIINDSSRDFIVSPFLYLEIVPKAVHARRSAEIIFYRTYFDNAFRWVSDIESVVKMAQEEAERYGLSAMDTLHVAAAYLGEADVLFTLEQRTKPMHRTVLVPLAYLEPVV